MLDDCWEWNGSRERFGYGQKKIKGRMYITHRLAYAWVNGPIPDGMCVLHSCDNPPCCNPNHLFLGTQQDNVRDRCKKNRTPRGEAHYMAKLSDLEVEEIRRLDLPHKEIAKLYGIGSPYVSTLKSMKKRIPWQKHTIS